MAKLKTTMASNKLGQIKTPIGSALFVSCPNASAFDENKQEASIVLSPEDYNTFMESLNTLIENYDGELVIGKADMKLPVKEEVDKDGNATGNYIVRAKTSMKYPARLYDAKGSEFKPDAGFRVTNRSKIKLMLGAELMATSMYKGLVLRLNALQVISDSPWANKNPFDAVEDGDFDYVAGDSVSAPETDLDEDWTN